MDGRGGWKERGSHTLAGICRLCPRVDPTPATPKLKFNLPRSHKRSTVTGIFGRTVRKPPTPAQFTTPINTINLCPQRFHSNLLNLPYNIRIHVYVFAFSSALNEPDLCPQSVPRCRGERSESIFWTSKKNKRICLFLRRAPDIIFN